VDRKIRLPKEGFIDGTEAEGQGFLPTDTEDVEGHRAPDGEEFSPLPTPPSFGLDRSPGHGGELHDSGEDSK